MPKACLCFLIPLLTAVVGFGLLTIVGANGWPGDVGAAGDGFCEASRSGIIKQPANTWSNAGFVLVGLAVGWQAWRDVAAKKSAAWSNRLVSTIHYPAAMATCSVLIGIGSTALHASTTRWAAELDHFAMHVWGAWCVAFALVRLFRVGDGEFYGVWLTLLGGIVTRLVVGQPYAIYGSTLFALMIALSIAIEALGRWRNRSNRQIDTHYLVWAVVLFFVADACRRIGTEANASCDPHSLWQGHAAWHVLCAGSTAFVYLYGRSERAASAQGEATHNR